MMVKRKIPSLRQWKLLVVLLGGITASGAVWAAEAEERPRPPHDSDTLCPLEVLTLAGPPPGSAAQPGYRDGPRAQALFNFPTGLAAVVYDEGPDPVRVLYVADTGNHCIRQIQDEQVRTVAGRPGVAGFQDTEEQGVHEAEFYYPTALVADGLGNLYVADTGNHAIRRIDAYGHVTTLAGVAGRAGFWDNDEGTQAGLNAPTGLAYGVLNRDPVLFVADTGNHCIRAVNLRRPQHPVTTVAGVCTQPGYNDDPSLGVRFAQPRQLEWLDWNGGLLFVADAGNQAIRLVRPSAQPGPQSFEVSTLLIARSAPDSPTPMLNPFSVSVDIADGHLFITNGHTIAALMYRREWSWYDDHLTLQAGNGDTGYRNGCGRTAQFNAPLGVATYFHRLAVADTENHAIRLLRNDPKVEKADHRCPRCGPQPVPE